MNVKKFERERLIHDRAHDTGCRAMRRTCANVIAQHLSGKPEAESIVEVILSTGGPAPGSFSQFKKDYGLQDS